MTRLDLRNCLGLPSLAPACALLSALAILRFAHCANEAPRVPCNEGPPLPAYALVGESPNIQTWKGLRWQAPPCLPWPNGRLRLVVALAARFHGSGDLLARLGAISAMHGIRYWSVTEGDWRVLITDAFASDAAGRRRPDFARREMTPGAELYFVERDNRSGVVNYRMNVLEAEADRIIVATENVSPVRVFGFTVFPPGSLKAAYFLHRLDGETWSFYGLSTTGEESSALAAISEASYVNRAMALYRHFTAAK